MLDCLFFLCWKKKYDFYFLKLTLNSLPFLFSCDSFFIWVKNFHFFSLLFFWLIQNKASDINNDTYNTFSSLIVCRFDGTGGHVFFQPVMLYGLCGYNESYNWIKLFLSFTFSQIHRIMSLMFSSKYNMVTVKQIVSNQKKRSSLLSEALIKNLFLMCKSSFHTHLHMCITMCVL